MFPKRLTHEAEARKHSGAFVDTYAALLMKGDPLADAFAVDVERLGHRVAMTMLDTAIDQGIGAVPDAPRSLVDLFAQLDDVPTWVDWERMRLGARAYQRTGAAGSLTLSAVSLMNGYHSSAAIKPLLFTGQLDKMARRRLAETGKFIAETIQVDGLRRFSVGFRSTVKVRIVHAFVRRMLMVSGRWDEGAWGLPINQADMGATNLSFSIALVHGVRTIGVRISREEADAIIHLWRYSGYLSGVDLAMLATNEEEAWYRAEVVDLMQPTFDDGSLLLAKALRDATNERVDDPIRAAITPYVMRYHDGLTRVVIGDEKADDLGTPNRRWANVVRTMAPMISAVEAVRERMPLATTLAERFGNQVWKAAVALELGDRPATFQAPKEVPFAHRFRRRDSEQAQTA